MIYHTHYASPLGDLLLSAQDGALTGLWIAGQKYFPTAFASEPLDGGDYPVLRQTIRWLDRYFAGERPEISELNPNPVGTEFQRQVWQSLCRIPYGETTTYGALARQLAQARGLAGMSAQAIGGAVGHNPVSIIIPCHRVVGANGSLTGYAGGIERKVWLLQHEHALKADFFVPAHGSAL